MPAVRRGAVSSGRCAQMGGAVFRDTLVAYTSLVPLRYFLREPVCDFAGNVRADRVYGPNKSDEVTCGSKTRYWQAHTSDHYHGQKV
jgi:hypothetical protein